MARRYAIIGAGITGLAAARRLREITGNSEIVVFDSRERTGGVLATDRRDQYLIEQSADMFTTEPRFGLELCEQLGLVDELVSTRHVEQRAFIFRDDRIHPVPDGFSLMLPGRLMPVLGSDLLSWDAKARLLQESQVPCLVQIEDESLKEFATRRLGNEIFDYLVQPLASGIYTADPSKLSMRATMQRFKDKVSKHGSLIAAARSSSLSSDNRASGARYDLFRAPSGGFGQLVDRLTEQLEQSAVQFRLGTGVNRLAARGDQWSVILEEGNSSDFDGVVVSSSARIAASLLEQECNEAAQLLNRITTASVAIVALGIDSSDMPEDFGGFGILFPACENREVIALSFSSNKFPGRAPEGKSLIRCFIGGALHHDLLKKSDSVLIKSALEHLSLATGFDGNSEFAHVYRWDYCMPQYHIGHTRLVEEIGRQMESYPTIQLAGNSYHGVGIPVCVQSGAQAAEKLVRAGS
ncbi:MAG: protoporphyrinogen oxidase [Planctomycetota bacterium]